MADILLSIKNMTGRYYRPVWEDNDRTAAFELCNIADRTQKGWMFPVSGCPALLFCESH